MNREALTIYGRLLMCGVAVALVTHGVGKLWGTGAQELVGGVLLLILMNRRLW
jgi:hypothetical protein